MAAAALLDANPNPSADEIDTAMSGNICRCGCYPRIKRAIQSVSENALAYDAMASAGETA
jgi:isoquinoline 1-oxidoreductase alpha subunit